jgi:hypothetical protein
MVGWVTGFCCPPSVSNGGQQKPVAHPTLASKSEWREYYLHQTEVTPYFISVAFSALSFDRLRAPQQAPATVA